MYVDKDYATKKAFREDVASGARPKVYSPGPFPAPTSGRTAIEGPHYPKPHTWYAVVEVAGGEVVKVVS